MRSTTALIAGALILGVATPGRAAELRYKWKKGDVHKFRYQADSTFEVSMPGMGAMAGMMGGAGGGMNMAVRTDSTFAIKVLKTRPDGTAEVELEVDKLDIVQGGQTYSAIDKVPPKGRKVRAEIDAKGRAKFYETIQIWVKDDQVHVGRATLSGSAGKHGARASASDGETTVEVYASVDPKTGRISAGGSVKQEKKAAPEAKMKTVEIKREDPGVDVLPKQIFEMMVLPDGDFGPGSKGEVNTPFGKMVVSVDEWTPAAAALRVKMDVAAAVSAGGDEGDAAAGGGGMAGMPDMGGMMGGLPGMGGGGGGAGKVKVTGKGGAKGSGGASSAMSMNADVTARFDHAAGRLLGIAGTIGSDMSAGSVSVKTATKLDLVRQ